MDHRCSSENSCRWGSDLSRLRAERHVRTQMGGVNSGGIVSLIAHLAQKEADFNSPQTRSWWIFLVFSTGKARHSSREFCPLERVSKLRVSSCDFVDRVLCLRKFSDPRNY